MPLLSSRHCCCFGNKHPVEEEDSLGSDHPHSSLWYNSRTADSRPAEGDSVRGTLSCSCLSPSPSLSLSLSLSRKSTFWGFIFHPNEKLEPLNMELNLLLSCWFYVSKAAQVQTLSVEMNIVPLRLFVCVCVCVFPVRTEHWAVRPPTAPLCGKQIGRASCRERV